MLKFPHIMRIIGHDVRSTHGLLVLPDEPAFAIVALEGLDEQNSLYFPELVSFTRRAADPGIAGFGEALFPPPRTALVRRARQTGVARHRFAVTHWSRQHLIDEHISRFNADADDPGHLPNHGVVPGLRLLLQPFLTGVLDLPDLADDKA